MALSGQKRMRLSSTSKSVTELIQMLTKKEKRQKQTEKIKSILQNSNKWEEDGMVERKLEAEMKNFEELCDLIASRVKYPVEETIRERLSSISDTITKRLSERYYDSITPQILGLTTFLSGTFLAHKVRYVKLICRKWNNDL